MFPYQDGKYFDLLYQAVQDCYPSVDKPSAKDILRELILSPKSDCIEINGTTYCKADIVQSLKRKLNNENEPKPFDERYHDLMEAALKTIKHMNDGYITEDDYTERNNFLSFINKKDIYYWNGNFKLAIVCSPAWSKEQCKLYSEEDLT